MKRITPSEMKCDLYHFIIFHFRPRRRLIRRLCESKQAYSKCEESHENSWYKACRNIYRFDVKIARMREALADESILTKQMKCNETAVP